MRGGVLVLARPAAAAGFALAGLETQGASDADAGARRVEALLERPDVGILFVEESIHAALDPAVRRAIAGRALPLVVPFPAPAWGEAPSAAEAFIVELLRRAIGYRVRVG